MMEVFCVFRAVEESTPEVQFVSREAADCRDVHPAADGGS